MSDFYFLNIQL